MVSQPNRSYAVTAGLSCGIGLAIPVVAYAATLPFEGVHGMASAAALPFAAGALAGVGVFAAAATVADRRARDAHGSFELGGAAGERAAEAEDDVRRFFGGKRVPQGVPVIARAQGAPSEREAWAEIDALLDEDSPISCDPATSKDIYEIAFEELRREAERTGSVATSATPSSAAAPNSGAALTTAAAPAAAAAQTTVLGAEESDADVTPVVNPSFTPMAASAAADADDVDDVDAARRAAIASLDDLGDGEERVAAAAVAPVSAPAPVAATSAAAPASVSAPAFDPERFSGHAGTWEEALAILAEAEPAAAPAASASDVEEPRYQGKHLKRTAAMTVPTPVPPSPERAEAVAEGARATQIHDHVNALIEEEFDRISSQSVRKTSHEYLRVIQGGTASMPRLSAEA